MGSFRPSEDLHGTDRLLASVDADIATPTAGRRVAVGTSAMPFGAGTSAQVSRSALGALARLRGAVPELEAAANQRRVVSPMLVHDARAALRRVDEAVRQLEQLANGTLGEVVDQAKQDLARVTAERDAIAPRARDLIAIQDEIATPRARDAALEADLQERDNMWRAEAAPIAAQLGLGPVQIRSDATARQITEGKAARGVALDGAVHLHPDRVQPGTPEGREVLAHELVHLAQAGLASNDRGSDSEADELDDRDEAELEAAALAPRLAAGSSAPAPRRFIDLSSAAADTDADRAKAAKQLKKLGDSRKKIAPKPPEKTDAKAKPIEKGSISPGTAESVPSYGLAGGNEAKTGPDQHDADYYLSFWSERIVEAIIRAIAQGGLPAPHPRLIWTTAMNAGVVADQVKLWFDLERNELGAWGAGQLKNLLVPTDLLALIDSFRATEYKPKGTVLSDGRHFDGGMLGPMAFNSAATTTIAAIARAMFVESLHRMAARIVASADAAATGANASPADIVLATGGVIRTNPMDLIVAPVIGAMRVGPDPDAKTGKWGGQTFTEYQPLPKGAKPDDSLANVGPLKLRPVTNYKGMAARDPNLWNWIEVIEPRDATVEEVAATIFFNKRDANPQSFWSPKITASPPFFALPVKWARDHSPDAIHEPRTLGLGGEDPTSVLAFSAVGDQVALDQAEAAHARAAKTLPRGAKAPAATPAADPAALIDQLDKTAIQLGFLKQLLGPWKVGDMLTAAVLFSDHARAAVIAGGPEVERWARVIELQSDALGEIATDVGQLSKAIGTPDRNAPAASVLSAYARAAGTAHLTGAGATALASARTAAKMLTVMVVERVVGESRDSVAFQGAAQDTYKTMGDTSVAVNTKSEQGSLDDRTAALRARVLAGQSVDTVEVDEVILSAQENRIRSQCAGMAIQLRAMAKAAKAADSGFFKQLGNTFDGEIRQLPVDAELMANDLVKIAEYLGTHHTIRFEGDPATVPQRRRDAARAAIEIYDGKLREFSKAHNVQKFVDNGWKVIEHAEFRAVIVELATMLAISIASGQIAGAAAGLVRGARLGALVGDAVDLYEASKSAQLLGAVTRIAVDVGMNSVGQHLVTGDPLGSAITENLIANLGASLVLKPFHEILGDIKKIPTKGMDKLWKGGVLVIGTGVNMSMELITGAAVSYVVHRMEHEGEPPPMTKMQWALQGAALAVGRVVNLAMPHMEQRLAAMGQKVGTKWALKVGDLSTRAMNLHTKASHVERSGKPEEAFETLMEYRRILDDESHMVEGFMKSIPPGLDLHMLHTHLDAISAARSGVANRAFELMPLRLQGLEETVVGGGYYRGTSEQIALAIGQAKHLKINVAVKAQNGRRWTLEWEGTEIIIDEIPRTKRQEAADAATTEHDAKRWTERAEAAHELQKLWEEHIGSSIVAEAKANGGHIARDSLQVGAAYAGTVNQHTKMGNPADTLVVYGYDGVMNHRTGSKVGQPGDKHDAPGVSVTAQTTDKGRVPSEALHRAIELGKFETQTPTTHGKVTRIERRPADGKGWPAELKHGWRAEVKVEGHDGVIVVYVNHVDYAGGMGPTDFSAVDTRGITTEKDFEALRKANLVVGGDDPDIIAKIRKYAKRTAVLGGSPTGAWAAEDVQRHGGGQVDLVGGLRPDLEWAHLKALAEAAMQGDLLKMKELIEKEKAASQPGSKLGRNTEEKGSAYSNPNVHPRVEYVDRMRPTKDGKVEITYEGGKVEIYDQVFVAHGQNPNSEDGIAGLIGKGTDTFEHPMDAVPKGTIELRPVYDGTDQLVALESVDPPGLRLVGAASANAKMAGWIEPKARTKYVQKVTEIAAAGQSYKDGQYTPVSKDSIGVGPGLEAQRQRMVRANEVFVAENFRIDGNTKLPLEPGRADTWPAAMEKYFTEKFRAEPGRVKVKLLHADGMGRTFEITIGKETVGQIEISFHGGSSEDRRMTVMLDNAGLTKMHVMERGHTDGNGGPSATMTDPGKTIADMANTVPKDHDTSYGIDIPNVAKMRAHDAAFKQLEAGVQQVASGLAELHARYRSGEKMTDTAKELEITKLRRALEAPGVAQNLGTDAPDIRYIIEGQVITMFKQAQLSATAYHGSASADSFAVTGEGIGTRNLGGMADSMAGGKGTRTGWADNARFEESIEANTNLSRGDKDKLIKAFRRKYREAMIVEHDAGMEGAFNENAAEKFYKTMALLERVRAGDKNAIQRLREETGVISYAEKLNKALDDLGHIGQSRD